MFPLKQLNSHKMSVKAETNCDATLQCEDDGGTPSCGPFKIKRVYWLDCGKPGNSKYFYVSTAVIFLLTIITVWVPDVFT